MRTLPILTRTLVLTTALVGTLTPVGLATAEAAAPPPAKTGHHAAAGDPVSRAEAFFTCVQAQQRSDRVQRIRQVIGKELVSMHASESLAAKENKPALVAYWKLHITNRKRYETYAITYWHSDYAKQKRDASYVLDVHKKGARAARGEARLKACKLKKLTFPASKTPKTPSTKKPQATAPSTTKPPASTTPSTTKPPASTTTTTGSGSTTTPSTTGSGSSTTTLPAGTTPASTTTTTTAGGTATAPSSTTPPTGPSTPGA